MAEPSGRGRRRNRVTNIDQPLQSGPAWLAKLHADLDSAVLGAYGWPANISDAELLERLLALNHERAPLDPADPPGPEDTDETLNGAEAIED